jgi:hypothetical protein
MLANERAIGVVPHHHISQHLFLEMAVVVNARPGFIINDVAFLCHNYLDKK